MPAEAVRANRCRMTSGSERDLVTAALEQPLRDNAAYGSESDDADAHAARLAARAGQRNRSGSPRAAGQ